MLASLRRSHLLGYGLVQSFRQNVTPHTSQKLSDILNHLLKSPNLSPLLRHQVTETVVSLKDSLPEALSQLETLYYGGDSDVAPHDVFYRAELELFFSVTDKFEKQTIPFTSLHQEKMESEFINHWEVMRKPYSSWLPLEFGIELAERWNNVAGGVASMAQFVPFTDSEQDRVDKGMMEDSLPIIFGMIFLLKNEFLKVKKEEGSEILYGFWIRMQEKAFFERSLSKITTVFSEIYPPNNPRASQETNLCP